MAAVYGETAAALAAVQSEVEVVSGEMAAVLAAVQCEVVAVQGEMAALCAAALAAVQGEQRSWQLYTVSWQLYMESSSFCSCTMCCGSCTR